MSRVLAPVALALVAIGCVRGDAELAKQKVEIGRVLDDFHDAAAKGDEPRYFGHFAKNAVFLGTDATERWEVDAFRTWAHPRFTGGKAWAFRSTRRAVTLSEDGRTAWFDEDLATEKLGPARGSGVVVRDASSGAWNIAQYNLSITIPNDRFAGVRKVLDTGAP